MNRYEYTGPIYHYGNKIAEKSNMITTAPSIVKAEQNFLYRISQTYGDYTNKFDIATHLIKRLIPITKDDIIENPELEKCPECGTHLTTNGECPICDLGEDDLLDDM